MMLQRRLQPSNKERDMTLEKTIRELNEKMLYKSPTGWKFELIGGKVVMIGKNSGKIEIPKDDFKVLQRIIGQVKL